MEIIIGDILNSKAQTIINTVNCVGIMGKGIAAEFKKRYPEMFEDYVLRCQRGEVKPGVPYLYKTLFPPQIINFPTKNHWRAVSHIEDIENGLKLLVKHYKEWGIESLAMPPLGCGNGQLLWETVGPMIYRYMKELDVPVVLYAPYGTPPVQLTEKFLSSSMPDHKETKLVDAKSSKINPALVALVEIVYRISKQKYHMPVGRTIFQKIAYVATALGIPTELKYSRGSYGPYCSGLDIVKKRLYDAGLIKEESLGRMLQILPGPVYEKYRLKYQDNLKQWNYFMDKTADLFLRLDTQKAEIVATVLFTERTINKGELSEKDVLDEVMKWKQRRRPPLNQEEVAETVRNLGMLKWFNLKHSSDIPLSDEWA